MTELEDNEYESDHRRPPGVDDDDLADVIDRELVGRNVIDDRWTFRIVENYDDSYWAAFRRLEQRVRNELVGGRRHLREAELRADRRTRGHPDHTPGPGAAG